MVIRKKTGHPAPKPTIDELLATRARVNRVSAEFLKIDLETALTFVKIAQQSEDQSRKQRNRRAARKAYDAVTKLLNRVELPETDDATVRKGLLQLKTELQHLGETF